jgi:DNA-binding beta-propeller fold protein YncE
MKKGGITLHRRFRWCVIAALTVMLVSFPGVIKAELPYRTFSYDNQGRPFFVQSAYIPNGFIGFNLVPSDEGSASPNLSEPGDIFIDNRDHLYIADTKNNRILHLDQNHKLVEVIGAPSDKPSPGALNEPNGVFISEDHTIYVADTGNKRIAVFNSTGTFIREYKRPETTFLSKSFQFEPTKLIVDKRGFLYIATNNGYQGLLVINSQDGNFQGFFGANRVPFNPIDYLKRRVFTKEQLDKEIAKRPGTVSNVKVDKDGLIYTTSISVDKGQIKKLNFSGKDLLGEKVYGPRFLAINEERLLVDVTVDKMGNMTAIDAQSGTVYQYDPLGELMFAFGNKNAGFNKLGLFNNPASIDIDSKGNLYIVDQSANLIQIFSPTEFALLVHKATELFMLGKYEESEAPWKEALHLNSNYYKAHLGLAKSYYRKGDWKGAMAEFRNAGDTAGYSDAFWQVRYLWLQQHFNLMASLVVAFVVIFYIWKFVLWKKWIRRKPNGRSSHSIKAGVSHPTSPR